jgi:hypothetical protein
LPSHSRRLPGPDRSLSSHGLEPRVADVGPEDGSAAGAGASPRRRRDRRRRPTPLLSRHIFVGRRRRNRRRDDPQQRYFVDRVDGWYRWVLLLAVAFVVFDTFSTLWILSSGGSEMNLLVARVLEEGTTWYIALKLLPLALLLPVMVSARHFPLVRVGTLLLFCVYGTVFLRHLIVWFRIHVHP